MYTKAITKKYDPKLITRNIADISNKKNERISISANFSLGLLNFLYVNIEKLLILVDIFKFFDFDVNCSG